MDLDAFAMERLQSIWENRVAWNLAESGVHPLRVEELVDAPQEREAVMRLALGYPQTNGTLELRSAIAAFHPGAEPANVLVTNGGSEANCVALLHLVQPGDEVVLMTPNYLQMRGLCDGLGAAVQEWALIEDEEADPPRWRPDLDALEELVTDRTRAVLICNPNNPTGARMTADEIDAVCRVARRVGAWVVSDEIYRGAELDGVDTTTVWGRYERVVVTGGLSKAYALPGLRIGWAVAPAETADALWGVHDYLSIAPSAVSDRLAQIALAPARRELLLARTRGILRTNYPVVQRWIERRAAFLSHIAPEAGAITLVKYTLPVGAVTLAERIRDEQSVLLVPGDHFGMEGYLRVGFGSDPELLIGALDRAGEVLDAVAQHVSRA